MMKKPKISIIVPVYNTEKYLDRCIKSIINQNYTDFELLIIDDGSTDNSYEVCNKYLDKRIKVFHKSNGGLSSARNYGLDNAKGSYVSFIDSDDYVNDNFLLSLIELIELNEADIAQCKIKKIYNDCIEENSIETIYEKICGKDILKTYFNNTKYRNNIYHNVCNKLFKKELFNDLRFKDNIYYEDLSIMYLLLDRAKKIVTTNESYYYYSKDNRNSITSSYSNKHLTDRIDILKHIQDYFIDCYEINDEFNYFILNQYINTFEESFKINNDFVINKREDIKKKISKMLKNNNFDLFTKLKIEIRLLLPYVHRKYKIIIGN